MAKSFAKSGVVRISYSRRAASSAFTNLRTGERCDNENALLAAILADATNFGLGRRAAASHGVTRDKLVWTAGACVRPETYKAALARIIDAHHVLPIATIWADGRTFLRISILLLRQARRRCGRDQRALRTWSRLPAARPITALSSAPCWASGTAARELPRARAAETWMASVVLPAPPFALPRAQTDAGTLAAKAVSAAPFQATLAVYAFKIADQQHVEVAAGWQRRAAATGRIFLRTLRLPESPAAISTAASPPTKPARPPADPDAVQGPSATSLLRERASESNHGRFRQRAVKRQYDVARMRDGMKHACYDITPASFQKPARWLRQPSSRWVRIPVGILLIIGSFLSILPVFGLWMLPLGMVMLAQDVRFIKRLIDRLLAWIEWKHPKWLGLPAG